MTLTAPLKSHDLTLNFLFPSFASYPGYIRARRRCQERRSVWRGDCCQGYAYQKGVDEQVGTFLNWFSDSVHAVIDGFKSRGEREKGRLYGLSQRKNCFARQFG